MGKDAPSTMPRHLHLVRDPRTHNKVARRMANERRARIQPITDPKGRSHLAHRNSHTIFNNIVLIINEAIYL